MIELVAMLGLVALAIFVLGTGRAIPARLLFLGRSLPPRYVHRDQARPRPGAMAYRKGPTNG